MLVLQLAQLPGHLQEQNALLSGAASIWMLSASMQQELSDMLEKIALEFQKP